MNFTEYWKDKVWLFPAIVFSLALLLFSINLDRPAEPDELHHVLAAQHLLETGRPQIGDGEYRRGILHTWMVALSYEVFGDGLGSARFPAALLAALSAAILFVWVRHEAGTLAAGITAALYVLSPFTVEIAQFSRFYSLQIVFFLLGCISIFYSLTSEFSISRRVALGVLASALFVLAISQQITTFFGIVGVAVWVAGCILQTAYCDSAAKQLWRRTVLVGGGAALALALVIATQTDVLEWALKNYGRASLFNADRQNEFWFYHVRFFLFYPTLWPLIGLLSLFGIIRSPKLAWFAVSVFGISFLLVSFAGSKAMRYFCFAQPFLAIIWGVGMAYAFAPLSRFMEATRTRLVETLALSGRFGSSIGTSLVALAFAIVFLMNPFWLRTATIIGDVALPYDTPVTNWSAAQRALAPWVDDADIIITTEELGAIYYLGRSDIRFSPSKIRELAPDQRHEFGIDYRTGRPIITKPESLEQLIQCFPRGLVVGPIEGWGSPILISEAVQAVILRYAKPIEVPADSHLFAWGWEHEPRKYDDGGCSDLAQYSGRQDGGVPLHQAQPADADRTRE